MENRKNLIKVRKVIKSRKLSKIPKNQTQNSKVQNMLFQPTNFTGKKMFGKLEIPNLLLSKKPKIFANKTGAKFQNLKNRLRNKSEITGGNRFADRIHIIPTSGKASPKEEQDASKRNSLNRDIEETKSKNL